MTKRLCILFFIFIAVFFVIMLRMSLLSKNVTYALSTAEQTGHYIEYEQGRGNFYDCQFRQLTGNTYTYYGLIAPTSNSYRELFDYIPSDQKDVFYESIQKSTPFLIELEGTGYEQAGITSYLKSQRYMDLPIASQLIGYTDSEGTGVAGLEAALDSMLEGGGTKEQIYCDINAQGSFFANSEQQIVEEQGTGFGVMLTLDAAIQRACEAIAVQDMTHGAIVVMDTQTGRIKASVSMPTYDPSNPQDSLNSDGAPFINRVISSYNVGSVFKPLLAAVAIENGYPINNTYTCTGSIEVGGHTYSCAYGISHGEITMTQALAVSCNTYFVDLGLELGAQEMSGAMRDTGFGQSVKIADGLMTSAGNVPTVEELENLGELASISFGQGTLTASPLQVTAFFNAIANDGVYVSPTFVEGYVDSYTQQVVQSMYNPVNVRWVSQETADIMQFMLVNVVADGLGMPATPTTGGAGGKTGTAQTGLRDEDGNEYTDAWFVGFYPANNPQYTVCVMLDSGTHKSSDASAIFASITDVLRYFV